MNPLLVLLTEVTVVFALALLAARLAARARAAVRHLILASAFAVALILPLATLVSPTITVEIAALPEREVEPVATDPVAPSIESGPADPATLADAITTQETPTRAASIPLATWLLLAWALIAALALVPVGASLWSMHRIRRHGRPWPGGSALLGQFTQTSTVQLPQVVLLDGIAAPMTGGLLRPVIALPADAASWSDVHLANALRHELEHVRRHDWVVHLAARAACALYWFHPLAWLAWRALRLEAERACDDAVLAREDAAAYAEQLLELARRMADKPGLPGLQMATGSNLASRIRALLDNSLPRGRAGRLVLTGVVVAALIAVIALAPLRATGPLRAVAEALVTSPPGISPTLAAEAQPVVTPPAPPFPYDSRVGLVALRDEGGCLSIFNSAVAAGTKLTLVRPRSSDPAGVMEATVGERQAGECPASLDRRHDAGIDPTYYRVTLSGSSKPPNGEVFAVLDPHGPIALRDGQIEADIDDDGQREFFGTCSSSENVHYVVWTQLPTQRRARWHGNIYYAYDMEVTCIDDDVLVPPEKPGEAATLVLGNYIAVTESEWNIELNLGGDGNATYTLSNWEAGKAAATKKSEVVNGRWEVKADVVTVSFGGENAGKTVTYRVTPCLSYQSFGAKDCSMGLEPVTNTMPRSFSQPLWSAIAFLAKTTPTTDPAAPTDLAIKVKAERATVRPGDRLALHLTFRNESASAFRLPHTVTPPTYQLWVLKLRDANTGKTFTGGAMKHKSSCAAMPGRESPRWAGCGPPKEPSFPYVQSSHWLAKG